MSLYFDDMDNIMVSVREAMEQTRRVETAKLRKITMAVLLLAKKMAPVDEGDLESAIAMRETNGGRDDYGRFVSKQFEVYVDGDRVGDDGKPVRDYAAYIHEYLEVYGEPTYDGQPRLGKRSLQKQRGQNYAVGGAFLDRALDLVLMTTV